MLTFCSCSRVFLENSLVNPTGTAAGQHGSSLPAGSTTYSWESLSGSLCFAWRWVGSFGLECNFLKTNLCYDLTYPAGMMKRGTSDQSYASRVSNVNQERCYVVIYLLIFRLKNEILELKFSKGRGRSIMPSRIIIDHW